MKKLLSILLVISILLAVLPIGSTFAIAPKGVTENGMVYEMLDNGLFITGYTADIPAKAVIPAHIAGYPVVGIADSAFANCEKITEVIINRNVRIIGAEAFYGCSALSDIFIPSNIIEIGSYAFAKTQLSEVVIPEGLEILSEGLFLDCVYLEKVIIPNSVISISAKAFYNCWGMQEIVIPDSVEIIGESAFEKCMCLGTVALPTSVKVIERAAFGNRVTVSNIHFSGTEEDRAAIEIREENEGLLEGAWHGVWSYNCGIFNGLRYSIKDDKITIVGYNDSMPAEVEIPATICGYPVVAIDEVAFDQCDFLESIVIPDSVISIGWCAFGGCHALKRVKLSNKLTTIETEVFFDCPSLEKIIIPNGVTYINEWAFIGCSSMTEVTIPKGVTTIVNDAFFVCDSLTNVYYGGSEEDRAQMNVGGNNDNLLNATWHYNCVNPQDNYEEDVENSVMDTDNGNGLAYRFELKVTGVQAVEGNKADFENATVNYKGKTCKLISIGTVVSNVKNKKMTLEDVDGKNIINIPVEYLCELDSNVCAFAVRIVDIPDVALDSTIYARPYYVIETNGEQLIVYGNTTTATCTKCF